MSLLNKFLTMFIVMLLVNNWISKAEAFSKREASCTEDSYYLLDESMELVETETTGTLYKGDENNKCKKVEGDIEPGYYLNGDGTEAIAYIVCTTKNGCKGVKAFPTGCTEDNVGAFKDKTNICEKEKGAAGVDISVSANQGTYILSSKRYTSSQNKAFPGVTFTEDGFIIVSVTKNSVTYKNSGKK